MIDIVFQLSPPSVFGLPGDDRTVLPGGEGGVRELRGPAVEPITFREVGHGTMSQYRPDGRPVTFTGQWSGAALQMRDNFLFVRVDTEDADTALSLANEIADRLALWLSSHLSAVVYPTVVVAKNVQTAEIIPARKVRRALLRAVWYHVPTIEAGIAECFSAPAEPRLLAGLRYYRLGLFLQEQSQEYDVDDFQGQLLAEAILNFWKAASSIVGDPSVDGDYQRRYRSFGLSARFFADEIEWLRQIRNDGGVAHYALQRASGTDLIEWSTRARRVANEVIVAARKTTVRPAE